MKWPAQSPDLNPIENLWQQIKIRFHERFMATESRPSRSLDMRLCYENILKELWYTQSQDLIDTLVESMPRRVQAVIEAKGKGTEY